MGRAGSVCLLDDQLSAVIEPLQGPGNRECQQQSDQGEYSSLDGSMPRHDTLIFFHKSKDHCKSRAVAGEVKSSSRPRNNVERTVSKTWPFDSDKTPLRNFLKL